MPQAQRVIGCAQRTRQGTALTQRRDTTTRSVRVGKALADLPSGERAKKRQSDAACVVSVKEKYDYRYYRLWNKERCDLRHRCGY